MECLEKVRNALKTAAGTECLEKNKEDSNRSRLYSLLGLE